ASSRCPACGARGRRGRAGRPAAAPPPGPGPPSTATPRRRTVASPARPARTAGAAASGLVAPWAAVVIGLVSGVIAVVGVLAVERVGIDDPIGAVAVHRVSGGWGRVGARR